MSIFLSFFMNALNTMFFESKEHLIINWYRFIATILSMVFIVSSYFVLNPTNNIQLYLWSGAHYFTISFFQILIRAELNNYKNNKQVSIAQANNYFGFSLNFVGIISIFIFGWYYQNNGMTTYGRYCIYLEVIFALYLLFVRGYFKDCCVILSEFGKVRVFNYIILLAIALITSAVLSLFVMSIGVVAPIITLGLIGFIYHTFKKTLNLGDLKLIINIALNYGLILAVFTGSVLTYFLHNDQKRIDIFNFSYSSEAFFSLLLAVAMAWSLIKGNSEYSRRKVYQQVSSMNVLVPIIFLVYYFSLVTEKHMVTLLIMMFGVYAFIEYMSMFFLRQVAQLADYNHFQGTRLASFNVIVLNGLCPSFIYLAVYIGSQFTSLALDTILITTIIGLIMISSSYNFLFRYRVR